MRQLVARAERALEALYLLCGALAAVAIALIAVLVGTSVVARLAGVYVGGLTEGAGYAMAAAGTLGLAYTFGSGGHVRVDIALARLRPGLRRRVDQLALIATAGAISILAYYFARMTALSFQFGDISDGSDQLPLWIPQFPAAVGLVVFAIALAHGALHYLLIGQSPVRDEHQSLLSGE